MPRDSNGNYTLPSGNPVVSGTTISSSWANTTMADLANEMTDSLDRSGKGGMLAPFKVADGTVAAPSLAFTNEPSTGFYRAAAGQLAATVGGSQVALLTSSGLSASALAATGSFLPSSGAGLYNPGTNVLGFYTNGAQAGNFDATQKLNLANPLPIASGGTAATTAAGALANLGIPAPSIPVIANTLAQRNSSGQLFASYFNQSSNPAENPGIGSIAAQNGAADGYIRFATIGETLRQMMLSSNVTIAADPGGTPSGEAGHLFLYY